MKWKRVVYVVLIIFLALFVFFLHRQTSTLFRIIFSEQDRALEEHIALLEPFLEIYTPNEMSEPLGVVVVVPGCLHTKSHNPQWHSLFLDVGYAVVVLDSFSPRGIKENELEKVCKLYTAQGFDRARDILAVVSYLKDLSWVDEENIFLAGWSHGGWAVMDAIALHIEETPPFYTDNSRNGSSGVRGAVLVYPHCGFGTAAYTGFEWSADIEMLMILGDMDKGIDWRKCVLWYEAQNNPVLDLFLIHGAEHTFDIPRPYNRNPSRFSPVYLKQAMDEVAHFLTLDR